ncbi:MAG: hypothetical protein HQL66_00780 [Magnetococcales bacterium]|nr:hypothetical protein [Magnetococcales bacterium]
MPHPLLELRSLLVGDASSSGRILSVSGSTARVATPRGVVEAAWDGVSVSGDRVTVRDGRVVKAQTESDDTPVFYM